VEFFTASFDDLSMFSSGSFDLVLSNFGGLNCASSLTQCAAEVARVVRPGGYFVAVVMPKVSLWEVVAGIAHMNFSWGFRRFAREVQATGFRGNTFTVSYYSPRSCKRFFAPWFTVCRIRGMNVLSPPPHAVGFRSGHPFLSAMLERWESRVAAFPLIRSVGDHFMIVLQRADTEHSE
jgi:SAM-dependent methyltransferase